MGNVVHDPVHVAVAGAGGVCGWWWVFSCKGVTCHECRGLVVEGVLGVLQRGDQDWRTCTVGLELR